MSDYINREDALTYLPQYPLKYSKKEVDAFLKGYQQHRIQTSKCEIVDVVERKRGKWKTAFLDHESFGVRPTVVFCSECHLVGYWETNFCPNCGAEMERPGE